MKLLFFACFMILAAACGVSQSRQATNSATYSPQGDNKIITTAYLDLNVKNIDTAVGRLSDVTRRYNGYVGQRRDEQFTVFIPAAQLQQAVTELKQYGKITGESYYTENITEAYDKNTIKLQNLEQARTRYLELLGKAQNVSEILLIEKELERINLELETIKNELADADKRIAYATLYLTLHQPKKPGPIGFVFVQVYKAVSWLFVRG